MLKFLGRQQVRCSEMARSTRAFLAPERRAFLWLLGFWTVVNLAYIHIGRFDLLGDEAQYWDWSRRLALGYYSKPPLIAYIIAALTSACGHKEWVIRSGAVLFSSGTLLVLHALTLRIAATADGGRITPRAESTGLLTVCVMLAMPASWVGSVLMTVDAPMVFFWVVAMYAFHRAVAGEQGYWWLVGTSLGLGMLAKYTVFLLAISFALYLVTVDRRPLRTAGPYLALCLMLALMSGVVYWNATNNWVSLRHTAAIGVGGFSPGKSVKHFIEFLGGQLGVASPILFGMFLWALWKLRKRFRTSPDAAFLFLCFVVPFGFYVLASFTRKSEPNWPVAAYMAAAPAFAWVWNERPRSRRARRLLAAGVILGCAIGIFPRTTDALYLVGSAFTTPSASPDRLYFFGLSLDPDKDPTNQLIGGRELGMELSRLLAESPGTPPFLFSNRYQLTAWEAFYTKGRPRTYCINIGDRRLNQYDLWGGWDELKGRDALFVTGWDETKASLYVGGLVQNGIFESGECVRIVRVYRCKTCVRQFTICRFHNFKGNLPEPPVGSY